MRIGKAVADLGDAEVEWLEGLLEDIEERLAAITPGIWFVEERHDAQLIIRTTDADVAQVFMDDLNGNPHDDVHFIASAPATIRYLLALATSHSPQRDDGLPLIRYASLRDHVHFEHDGPSTWSHVALAEVEELHDREHADGTADHRHISPAGAQRDDGAEDRVNAALNEWRMEDDGNLWCPPEEQPRLVEAVVTAAGAQRDELREAPFFKAVGEWYDKMMAAPTVDGAHQIDQTRAAHLASLFVAFWPEVRAALDATTHPKEDG